MRCLVRFEKKMYSDLSCVLGIDRCCTFTALCVGDYSVAGDRRLYAA